MAKQDPLDKAPFASFDPLEAQLAEDAKRIAKLSADLNNLSPAVAPMMSWLDEQIDLWEAVQGAWDGAADPAVINRLRQNISNASADRLRLANASASGDDDAIELVMLDLHNKLERYTADGAMVRGSDDDFSIPQAVAGWSPTIKPGKPPRNDWPVPKPDAPSSGLRDFIASTPGKIVIGLGAVFLARKVWK